MTDALIIVRDNDCHDYLIPESNRADWDKWLDSEDAEDGIIPDYAQSVCLSRLRIFACREY